MNGNVDCRVGTIGQLGALVKGERIVSIPKEQGRHALRL